VKLAEQHEVKSQNWVAYFIEKPLLSFAFVPFLFQ
jgi:hypothetical protein